MLDLFTTKNVLFTDYDMPEVMDCSRKSKEFSAGTILFNYWNTKAAQEIILHVAYGPIPLSLEALLFIFSTRTL